MKRTLSLLFAIAIMLSLVSCTSTPKTNESGTSSVAVSTNEDKKTTNDKSQPDADKSVTTMGLSECPDTTPLNTNFNYKVDDNVASALKNSGKVSVYTFSKISNDFKKIFEEQYGGKLEIIGVENLQYATEYFNDFAAGISPDVVILRENNWPTAAIRNTVMSITQLQNAGVLGLDHPVFSENAAQTQSIYAYNGNVYGIGNIINYPIVMLVNNALLRKCGVTKLPIDYYTDGSWNWDNFLKICDAITLTNKTTGTDYDAYCGHDYNYILQMNGTQIISLEKNGQLTANLDSSEIKQSLQLIRDFQKNVGIEKFYSFENDNQAMITVSSETAARELNRFYKDKKYSVDNYSVLPLPQASSRPVVQDGLYLSYAVSSATSNTQGAVNFIIAMQIYNEGQPLEMENDLRVWLNDEGKKWFGGICAKSTPIIFDGITQVRLGQWDFWDAVTDGKMPIDEVVSNFKPMFDSALKQEMK